MNKIKNAAALLLAAGMTILPAYSLTQAYRMEQTITSALPPATEEEAESGETGGNESLFPPGENVPSEETPEESAPSPPDESPALPPPEEEENAEEEENEQLYICCEGSGVNLRSGAGSGYTVVATAEKGTSYAVAEKTGGWYCVYYRGKKVYLSAIYAREVTLKKSDAAVEAVLEEGYKLIGTPYVYGAVRLHDGNGNLLRGFTKNAFDCSSLTQYTFFTGAHVLLGTTTRIQVREGTYVKRSELRRGDCIYFTNASRYYNTGIERVGHVAIYLGEGYILHTSSDYARIEKLTAAREKYYIEARRFV
ncbi:MAG: C40 family peptidase [Candidatus Borkfalkiaceae bacterium]|nr:C40 family peptidase [Clostridia bacterium]MDY6222664.1 C40 family peptidase [Christensenellaceae bacterium]